MPGHSIALRRQRRKSRPPKAPTKRAQAAPRTSAPTRTKSAPAPQPPYPNEDRRIARAARIILTSPAAGPARYALFVLALLAEDDLTVSISQPDMGALLGDSVRSVRRIMSRLRELGALIVTREHRGQHPAVYRIVPTSEGTV